METMTMSYVIIAVYDNKQKNCCLQRKRMDNDIFLVKVKNTVLLCNQGAKLYDCTQTDMASYKNVPYMDEFYSP